MRDNGGLISEICKEGPCGLEAWYVCLSAHTLTTTYQIWCFQACAAQSKKVILSWSPCPAVSLYWGTAATDCAWVEQLCHLVAKGTLLSNSDSTLWGSTENAIKQHTPHHSIWMLTPPFTFLHHHWRLCRVFRGLRRPFWRASDSQRCESSEVS